jgi:hypothetical protein
MMTNLLKKKQRKITSHINPLNQKKRPRHIYDVENPGPGLGQAQQ